MVLAVLSPIATWCRRSGGPIPGSVRGVSWPAFASTWSPKSALKNRVHSTLINFGPRSPTCGEGLSQLVSPASRGCDTLERQIASQGGTTPPYVRC